MNAYEEVLKGVQWVLDNRTSYEVAKDLGISNRTINRYQNGTTPIDNMTAKTMGTIYNYYLREMGKMITIEKKNNHKGIIGEEFKEVYSQDELLTAKQRIIEITDEYEKSINMDGHDITDLDDWEQEEYAEARNVIKGDYSFNCGDYTYYITINKGVVNMTKQIKQAIDYGLSVEWVKAVTGQETESEAIETLEEMYVDTDLTVEQFVFEKLQEDGRVRDEDAFDDEAEANAEGYYWYDEVSKWVDVE